MVEMRPRRRTKKYGPLTVSYSGAYQITSVSFTFLFWRFILWQKARKGNRHG